jgi:hypothetical protein
MKYLKLFESHNELESRLEFYRVKNYIINKDGSIDVNGDVDLTNDLVSDPVLIPFNFNHVNGFFDCSDNELISLKGSPKIVGGDFTCSDNRLSSLVGGPKEVGGNFCCDYNKLTNLKWAPKVGGTSFVSNNPLPKEILDNINIFVPQGNRVYMIDYIIKHQDDYSIWDSDGTLNKYRFKELLRDI